MNEKSKKKSQPTTTNKHRNLKSAIVSWNGPAFGTGFDQAKWISMLLFVRAWTDFSKNGYTVAQDIIRLLFIYSVGFVNRGSAEAQDNIVMSSGLVLQCIIRPMISSYSDFSSFFSFHFHLSISSRRRSVVAGTIALIMLSAPVYFETSLA